LLVDAGGNAEILELFASDRDCLRTRVQEGDPLPDVAILVLALGDLPGEPEDFGCATQASMTCAT
jgi:hypothetical protein